MSFLLVSSFSEALHASSFVLLSVSAGLVGKKIITSREVQINYIIETSIYGKKKEVPMRLKIQNEAFLSQVDTLLLEEALYLEARNFFTTEKNTTLLLERIFKEFKEKIKESQYWLDQRTSDTELRSVLEKKILVKQFMLSRIESSLLPTTEKEAFEYYEKNKKKFRKVPFRKLKKNIMNYLSQENLKSRLNHWFQILKKKYKIQNLLREV